MGRGRGALQKPNRLLEHRDGEWFPGEASVWQGARREQPGGL